MMHFCLALLADAAFFSMLWLEATAKRKLAILLDWQILCMFAGNCHAAQRNPLVACRCEVHKKFSRLRQVGSTHLAKTFRF